jgi:hypothetical protein
MREEKENMIWVKYIGRKPSITQPYNHKKYSWDLNTPDGMVELIPMGLFSKLNEVLPNQFLPVPGPKFEKELDDEERILGNIEHKKPGRPRK